MFCSISQTLMYAHPSMIILLVDCLPFPFPFSACFRCIRWYAVALSSTSTATSITRARTRRRCPAGSPLTSIRGDRDTGPSTGGSQSPCISCRPAYSDDPTIHLAESLSRFNRSPYTSASNSGSVFTTPYAIQAVLCISFDVRTKLCSYDLTSHDARYIALSSVSFSTATSMFTIATLTVCNIALVL